MYNFSIFDIANKEAICYCYDESIGSKGSNEVASFVFDYIAKKVKTDFRFYSDNCSGQNRKRYVFAMNVYAAYIFKILIIHHFLEPGHMQNENGTLP